MANSSEYRTIILYTGDLRRAVQSNLISLSGVLLAAGLISADNESELRHLQHTEVDRAARLVELVRNKVHQDSRHFNTFLGVLCSDNSQYADILHKLNETRRSLSRTEPGGQTAASAGAVANQGSTRGVQVKGLWYKL